MNCSKCKKEIPSNSIFCLHCGHNQSKQIVNSRPTRSRPNSTGSIQKCGTKWKGIATIAYYIDPNTGKSKRITQTQVYQTKADATNNIKELFIINDDSKRKIFDMRQNGIAVSLSNSATMESTSMNTTSSLADLWEGYSTSEMLTLSIGSQNKHKRAFKRLSGIDLLPISEITIHDLQRHIDEMELTFYPAREIRDLLSHLYKRGVAQGDAHTNLSEFISLPKHEERIVVPFTNDQLTALWKDYGDGNTFTGYILLLIYTAMMPGELFQLNKDMVDWENQRILGAGLKTEERKKVPIVVPNLIIPVLQNLSDNSSSDMILNVTNDAFYTLFQATMERLEIADKVPYDCRHTTATTLAASGLDIEQIKTVMRHTNIKMTGHYIHAETDTAELLKAINKIHNKLIA